MADENERRFDRNEKDIEKLQDNDVKHFERIANHDKNQAETVLYVKQIFEKLNDLKIAVDKDIEKSTVTENMVVGLKVVTDSLVKDLEEITLKVTAIEQLPAETAKVALANSKKMKFMIWQWLLGSGVALAIGIYKAIIWLNEVLNK